jgi:TPR repeat protein
MKLLLIATRFLNINALKAATKLELPEAYTMLGQMCEFGLGRSTNMTEALKWYEKVIINF